MWNTVKFSDIKSQNIHIILVTSVFGLFISFDHRLHCPIIIFPIQLLFVEFDIDRVLLSVFLRIDHRKFNHINFIFDFGVVVIGHYGVTIGKG